MATVVLTGEGAKGSFQAGVIRKLQMDGVYIDKYVGISSGALNAFLFSQIKPGPVVNSLMALEGIGDVFRFNYFTFPWNLGLFNTGPIRRKLESLLHHHRLPLEERKPAVIADVNYKTGNIRYTDLSKIPTSKMVDRVLSAISIAGLITPTIPDHFDAGARDINPLSWEMEHGKSNDIRMIFGRPIKTAPFEPKKGLFKFAIQAFRSMDLSMHGDSVRDLTEASRMKTLGRHNKDVFVYEPLSKLYDPLDFHRSKDGYEIGVTGKYRVTKI